MVTYKLTFTGLAHIILLFVYFLAILFYICALAIGTMK